MRNQSDRTPDRPGPGDRSDPGGADAVGGSIAALRRQVAPIEPDSLVHAVRGHMDVRARRRRRTVRLVVSSGCVVVILLAIVAVGLRNVDRGPTHVVRSVLYAADEGPAVRVEPASDLIDGQQLTVTAYGFDTGTPVDFFLCMSATDLPGFAPETPEGDPAPRWICQGHLAQDGTLAKVSGHAAPFPADGSSGSADHRSTRATVHYTVSEAGDPLVSITSDGSISVQRWVLGADFTIPRCGSTRHADSHDGSSPTSPAQPVQTRPCMFVAVGSAGGTQSAVASDALIFTRADDRPRPTTTSQPKADGGVVPNTPAPRPESTVASQPGVTPSTTSRPSSNARGCPSQPPQVSLLWDRNPDESLLDFVPTKVTVCDYRVDPAVPLPVAAEVTDRATIARIVDGLHHLPTTSARMCTAEGGESLVLLATAGSRQATITVEFFGCHLVGNGSVVREGSARLEWIAGLA